MGSNRPPVISIDRTNMGELLGFLIFGVIAIAGLMALSAIIKCVIYGFKGASKNNIRFENPKLRTNCMTSPFEMTSEQVRGYTRDNAPALLLQQVATDDYSGARCCLLNGPLVGLILAAQAVEKYLKAIILLRDPAYNLRSLNHILSNAVSEATRLETSLDLSRHSSTISSLEQHYNSRYPDNLNQPSIKGTHELVGIDELIIDIVEQIPLPIDIKHRTGLYACVCSSRERKGSPFPDEIWITKSNAALTPLLPRIHANHANQLDYWKIL